VADDVSTMPISMQVARRMRGSIRAAAAARIGAACAKASRRQHVRAARRHRGAHRGMPPAVPAGHAAGAGGVALAAGSDLALHIGQAIHDSAGARVVVHGVPARRAAARPPASARPLSLRARNGGCAADAAAGLATTENGSSMQRRKDQQDARDFLTLAAPLRMVDGMLATTTIAYETWGELNPARDNAVLLFTGLSPSAHAAASLRDPSPGWWEPMLGTEKPIDTSRHFVICVNSLGSCFGSSGPATVDPATGEPYRLEFPVLHIEDIANAAHHVVRHLGIPRLHAVVGASMGGMSALAYAVLHPGAAAALVSISSAARASPFAIALRSLQREIIRRDPAWRDGAYPPARPPVTGMRLARKLGMISYRSAAEWEQRFGRERVTAGHDAGDPFCIDFEVEAYLEAQADKFTGAFDANCYLYLSRAMDLFDIADHGGSVHAGIGRCGVERALVIGVETDFLFPVAQQRELGDALIAHGVDVDFHVLPSLQGHDAFLVDMDRFRPVIAGFFAAARLP
jgi:homoserine O-acetyltransferase